MPEIKGQNISKSKQKEQNLFAYKVKLKECGHAQERVTLKIPEYSFI